MSCFAYDNALNYNLMLIFAVTFTDLNYYKKSKSQGTIFCCACAYVRKDCDPVYTLKHV